MRRIRSGLAEAGDAYDDQIGIGFVQNVGREPHLFQRAGPVVLDQHVGLGDETQQRVLRRRVAQVEHDGALVAAVGLPVQRLAVVAPLAQRIALRRLDLDDVGAEIAELQRQHVAGDEPRQVEHADAVERTFGAGFETDHAITVKFQGMPRDFA